MIDDSNKDLQASLNMYQIYAMGRHLRRSVMCSLSHSAYLLTASGVVDCSVGRPHQCMRLVHHLHGWKINVEYGF